MKYLIPVIISIIGFGVLTSGCICAWTSTIDEESEADTLNLEASISASSNYLTLEVISGTVTWSDYRVTVDGIDMQTEYSESSAGDSADFFSVYSAFEPLAGESYNVRIMSMESMSIVWQKDVTATN